ncbi:GNAT family N-acetyltransferase [Paenibacillus sp. MWE-103]|uniref:GNAT family N-acetyltransferase n=1 Tax=Paenibacillus artemisiicola TaxID=1172618 RepID=A0ABS3WFV7_9BACL|nr:GNAT family protein [Paenibacillus artemisiicola]MBO7747212.1 GNAT family N-acetyltransferase [Paenibacillus artemisiicola]
MDYRFRDLFRGELLRFAAAQPDDAAELSRFTESYDYLRNVDTDYAVPQPAAFFEQAENGKNTIEFMLRTLEDDRLVGFAALHGIEWNNRSSRLAVGIGDAEDRGKGYGKDAVAMLLRYAFLELNLERISLEVIAYNEAAIRVYEKAGFAVEGRLREAVLRGGRRYDLIAMGLLAREWAALRGDAPTGGA